MKIIKSYISADTACLVAVFFLTAVLYGFGLSGGFLLDDFATLPFLSQWGQIDSWDKLVQFVAGGFTGPTGRPVSLISFLVHGGVWPDDPKGFLIFNVLCHLINGGLLFIFLRLLVRVAGREGRYQWLPLISTILWIIHPLHVSSVLYIIQRMVLLSALFNLIALIAYILGRQYLQAGKVLKGCCYLGGGALAATLAVYSKENAVLIPLQFLLLEAYFLWSRSARSSFADLPLLNKNTKASRVVIVVATIIPSLIILGYVVLPIIKNTLFLFEQGRELGGRRTFTLFERLMTEQRIVGDYLIGLVIPKMQSSGVFYDGYPVSKGLFQPLSTFLWFLFHSCAVLIALLWRRSLPFLAFAVLWFYANHLLESTSVMLELKFEHRNYIPSVGVCILAALCVMALPGSGAVRKLVLTAMILILGMLLAGRSSLWGQPDKAALVWVEENPGSTRALENAAMVYSGQPGMERRVVQLLTEAADRSDGHPVALLKLYSYQCGLEASQKLDVDAIAVKLATSSLNWQLGGVLIEIMDKMVLGACHLDYQRYQKMLQAASTNIYNKRTRLPLTFRDLMARSELVFGSHTKAIDLYLSQSYARLPLGMIMKQSLWLASYGELEAAVTHLDRGLVVAYEADKFLIMQAQEMREKIVADITGSKG